MFFYLSKIIEIFLSPFFWIGVLLLLSLLKPKKRKPFLLVSVVLFLLLGNRFLADELMRVWENPAENYRPDQPSYQIGILLGGGIVQIDKKENKLIFRHNTDRLFQAIELYKSGKIKKLMISGGSGDLYERDMKEGALLLKYLISIGIPSEDILVDSLSDNTHENAVNSAILIGNQQNAGRCLLITSAFHMRRSMACFKKEGVSCDPYPTNRNAGPRRFRVEHLLVPSVAGFMMYERLLHEVVGFGIYKILGYV